MTINKFPLWRWLFWRRVTCHKCPRYAVMKCVARRSADKAVWGDAYVIDALCEVHGKLGPCPDTVRLPISIRQVHIPIPNSQLWLRVRLRVRIWFEDADD